jgi:putative ABC transport system permease protein
MGPSRIRTPGLLIESMQRSDLSPNKKKAGVFSRYAAFFGIMMFFGCRSAHAAMTTTTTPARLGLQNLVFASIMLISLGEMPLVLSGIPQIAKALAFSASRCALQVSLLGSVILQRMMGVSNPGVVIVWVVCVGIIAGREAISRIQYSYPTMERNIILSVLTGGLTVLSLTFGLSLLGTVDPWFCPRTWISIAGMLFGNTLNASSLGASTITKQFASRADTIELRLSRGATVKEATLPLEEETYRTALTPTINGLAATGIVHIPGMMTGQILAGSEPQQAALYQIIINFLIATVATVTVQLVVISSVRALVDSRNSRLRRGILVPKTDAGRSKFLKSIVSSIRNKKDDTSAPRLMSTEIMEHVSLASVQPHGSRRQSPNTAPVLEISNLHVARAGKKINRLVIHQGDRVAIRGKSGIGKSQLLRTIVGLEDPSNECTISLFGREVEDITDYRSKVILVSQNIPALEGTPRQLYEEILKYRNHACRRNELCHSDPMTFIKKWDLEENVFERPWSSLSGGQSQRVCLAIALSLDPKVLLLDESTNALDDNTLILVEKTLVEMSLQTPIMVVTHSQDQVNRFCTHRIDL